MTIQNLIDDFDSEYLEDYLDVDYSEFDDEVGFIEYTKDKLDGASVESSGGSIDISTDSVHKSPEVLYGLPNGSSTRKELGDFLFVLEVNSGGITTRRAMLTQAKFSKSAPTWDIDLHQYHLISELPDFIVISPKTYQSFSLDGVEETSFANFVFASQFDDPFYVTGERIKSGVTNFDYNTADSTFNRSRLTDKIWPIEYSRSIFKRFFKGTFGTRYSRNSEISRLVHHLRAIANNWHIGTFSTDGGEIQDEIQPEFLIVNINIEYEGQGSMFGVNRES